MRQESLGRPFRRANTITAQAPMNSTRTEEVTMNTQSKARLNQLRKERGALVAAKPDISELDAPNAAYLQWRDTYLAWEEAYEGELADLEGQEDCPALLEPQEFVVTVTTPKAPQGSLQIPVLATDRDDAQDKAIDWMEFMGIPHGEVLKVVLKGEAA